MIRVDDEVYERLNELGRTEDSFNDVVRRVLGLASKKVNARALPSSSAVEDKGVSEVRKDIELFGIIDRHLPAHWKETEARRDQIMEVVKNFLRMPSNIPVPERHRKAAKEVAKGRGVEENTVLDKCGRQIFGTGSGLVDQFRDALIRIEADIKK